MKASLRATCGLVLLLSLFHADEAVSQPSTSLYGIVLGNDHAGQAPEIWEVSVSAFYSGRYHASRKSELEVYLYNIPRTVSELELIYAAPGYITQSKTVSLTGQDAKRVSNVTLELEAESVVLMNAMIDTTQPGDSIRVVDSTEPEELRQHLLEQAALSERGGPNAVEVFQWNLQLMEAAYRRSPALLDVLEDFKTSPHYERIGPSTPDSDRNVYRALIGRDGEVPIDISPAELLHFVQDTSRSSVIRAHAIRALTENALSGSMQQRTLHFMRGEETHARPAFLPALLTGLARIGDPEDRARVLQATTAPEPLRVRAAIEAIRESNLDGGGEALSRVVQDNPDPELRAAAVRALGVISHPDAISTLTEAATDDTAVVVRMEAVRALNRIETPAVNKVEVQRAIQEAQLDVSPEVRREALRVRQPR